VLIEELMGVTLDECRNKYMADFERVELLIIDDPGMGKLPPTAAVDLLEIIMRRYERASEYDPHIEPTDPGLRQGARRHSGGDGHV